MFRIRKAVPDGGMEIAAVQARTWKTTYTGLLQDEIIQSRLDGVHDRGQQFKKDIQEKNHFLVADMDGTVIGFCVYGPSRNEDYSDSGELYALYILKEFQGMGIGKALFESALSALRKSGYPSMILNCLQGNPSVGFYRHMGSKHVGQRQDELFGLVITEDILLFNWNNPEGYKGEL